MSFLGSIDVSGSGLTAQRLIMDLISNNIANVNTTRTPEGGPYQRQVAVFTAKSPKFTIPGLENDAPFLQQGVEVTSIVKENSSPRLVYNPQHPDADNRGYLALPNVNVVTEMVDMIAATRAYEANATSIASAKSMALKALEIGK